MGSSKGTAVSLLDAYEGLDHPPFLSLYHVLRIAAGGELPQSDWAASQIFPSSSRDRAEWKAAHFSELCEITEIITNAIKNGHVSVYAKKSEGEAPTEINTKAFLNKAVEFMPCLEDIKSGDVTYRYIYFKTDEVLGIFVKKQSGIRAHSVLRSVTDRKRPGKAPEKREKVKQAILQALMDREDIESLTQEKLAQKYGCSRETACRALEEALKECRQR